MLKYTLLGFLTFRPQTGYDLHTYMEASTAHFWNAKLSQIYTTLKKLEADGWVESEMEAQDDRPDKRIYYITEQGQASLNRWLQQPNTDLDQMKSKLLLKLFFSGLTDLESVLTELKLQKSLHQEQLQRYQTVSKETIKKGAEGTPNGDYHKVFWEATRQFGIQYETMVMEWLDNTINILIQLKQK